MRISIVFLFSLLMINCKSVRHDTHQAPEDLIKSQFGENVTITYNASKSHVLCAVSQKSTLKKPGNSLDYGIMDISANRVVYREQKYNASVQWANDTIIHVKSRPEVHSVDMEVNKKMMNYYINVKTLEKTTEYPQ